MSDKSRDQIVTEALLAIVCMLDEMRAANPDLIVEEYFQRLDQCVMALMDLDQPRDVSNPQCSGLSARS